MIEENENPEGLNQEQPKQEDNLIPESQPMSRENNPAPSDASQMFGSRQEMNALWESVQKVRTEMGKIIIGQNQMIELMIAAVLADGHILLEGVPGVAKTLTAKLLAKTISIDFSRVQFTPDLMPSDVLGTSVFNQKTTEFEFKKGPIFSNIVLIDEINRAPAKTQSALFEVMEEKQVTIDGTRHLMNLPFLVIATQNPIEQEGTYRLPEAQLDRFMFKIEVGYPSPEDETRILLELNERKGNNDISKLNAVLSGEEILKYRELVKSLHIDRNLIMYIAKLVDKTRNNSSLYVGASPRASISLMHGSKALAAIRGRDFVTPEDIKFIAPMVLGHRIAPTPEKEMEGIGAKDIVNEIIDAVEVPR